MGSFFIGFIASAFISLIAYKRKSLSLSGAVSAVVVGTLIYFYGGLYLSSIMVAFFVSASIATKVNESYKKRFEDINEKAGARDYMQVAANGLIGCIFAFLYYTTKNNLFLVIYAASFAAANADTWASELGVLSKSDPISILSFKKVSAGFSGGVSALGIIASFLGSLFIAAVFYIGYIFGFGYTTRLISYSLIITAAGFSGSIIDSIIGAAFQEKFRCDICGKYTEKRYHHGKATTRVSGIRGINNDLVNFISVLVICGLAAILYKYI